MNSIIETLPFRYEVKKKGFMQIREGIRVDYNRIKEQIDAANVKIGSEKERKNPDEKIIHKMEQFIKDKEKDIKQLEEQMAEMDKAIPETESTKIKQIEAARSYKGIVEKLLKEQV